MGQILVSYFKKAEEKGGIQAQVKLAMITKMSSIKAQEAPDSPENIKIFEEALAQL
ncbi:MAG TPA: hypothetical protein PKL83_00790 [bacterium]|nr:hypothetical protein [bacterium]